MYLNNVNFLNKVSIRTRFTLLYSIAAFSLLALITIFLYWESVNILYKTDYQFLSDQVDAIEYALENKQIHLADLKQQVIDEPMDTEGSIYKYYVRILDDKNKIVMETPGIHSINLFNPGPKTRRKQTYRWHSSTDANYLVIQSPISFIDNQGGWVQVALNISWQHTVMSDRKYFTIALIISAFASLLLGFYITKRGMKSLYFLTHCVKNITVTSLHQRIDPDTLPKELTELVSAFNQMLDRIESSFVRLKQFSSDLAHELRMPINNMMGETEIILSRNHCAAEYQQVMLSNLEEYQRVSHMIENILFLSRAENPQLDIEKTQLNVHEEIACICEYYEAMAEEKNISITHTGKAILHGNSVMFRRMINNLLSNAIKYTGINGWIKFAIQSDTTHVCIQLSDNGIGIAKEHLPRIFDRFYRVDSARSQQSGGIGLGLAIVKSIIDLHHGSITINSEPDTGTHIFIIFPRTKGTLS
jgi:two-component system heavy metal sensor histidine kinase CusS